MKYAEFRRHLESLGAKIIEGAKHSKIYLNEKQTTLPRHSGEIPEGTRKAILRQLGVKKTKEK